MERTLWDVRCDWIRLNLDNRHKCLIHLGAEFGTFYVKIEYRFWIFLVLACLDLLLPEIGVNVRAVLDRVKATL